MDIGPLFISSDALDFENVLSTLAKLRFIRQLKKELSLEEVFMLFQTSLTLTQEEAVNLLYQIAADSPLNKELVTPLIPFLLEEAQKRIRPSILNS